MQFFSWRDPQNTLFRRPQTGPLLLAAFVAAYGSDGFAQGTANTAGAQQAIGQPAQTQPAQSAGGVQKPENALPADDSRAPLNRREVLRRLREAKRERLTPYVVSDLERRVEGLEDWSFPRRLFGKGFAGFRPVVGGMPSGSGFVAGGGYIAGPASEVLQATANVRHSTRLFAAYDAGLRLFPEEHSDRPITGRLGVHLHEFGSLRHFGIGADTRLEERSFYRLTERALEATAAARLGPFLRLEGGLRRLSAEAEPGTRGVSLATRFSPWEIAGFGTFADYAVYAGKVALTLRDRETTRHVGAAMQLALERYDERSGDRFDFTRVVGELQLHVPIGYRSRILALRARTSHAVGRNGGQPPFYFLETLGGADTLRGFREYRFRDTRNLLFNVEYRWEVWTHVDFAFFSDFGKVFSDAGDMSLRDLKTSSGFGIRGHTPGGAVVRIDFAWSEEGFVLHVGSGPSF